MQDCENQCAEKEKLVEEKERLLKDLSAQYAKISSEYENKRANVKKYEEKEKKLKSTLKIIKGKVEESAIQPESGELISDLEDNFGVLLAGQAHPLCPIAAR